MTYDYQDESLEYIIGVELTTVLGVVDKLISRLIVRDQSSLAAHAQSSHVPTHVQVINRIDLVLSTASISANDGNVWF